MRSSLGPRPWGAQAAPLLCGGENASLQLAGSMLCEKSRQPGTSPHSDRERARVRPPGGRSSGPGCHACYTTVVT
eukprot:8497603-Pyramimonas_sp.AAC.1